MATRDEISSLAIPPVLPWIMRTVWHECRWSSLCFLAVHVLNGLTPAAQVAFTAGLLGAVVHLPQSGLPGFASALPMAFGLIAVTVVQDPLWHVATACQERFSLDLRYALDGRTLAVSAQAPLALLDRSDWYDLVQAAGTSAGTAAEKVLEQMAWLLQRAISVVTVGLLLAAAAWWLPLALLCGIVPTAFWELWQGDQQRRHSLHQAPAQRVLAYLGSLLAGDAGEGEAAELRLYGLGGHVLRRWRALYGRLGKAQVQFQAARAAVEFPVQVLRVTLFLGGLIVLGSAVFHGKLGASSFIALMGGLSKFNSEATNIAASMRRIRIRSNALADFGRLAAAAAVTESRAKPVRPVTAVSPSVLSVSLGRGSTRGDAPVPPVPSSGLPFPRPLRRGLVFEGVSFSYSGSTRPVLSGLDLTLRAGECLALVGANGSGKSTLVKLLLGLYVPDEGRILADGLDLASVDPRARRAAISAVFQDHIRFQLTVAEAIGFGDLHTFLHTDAGRARLRRAARAAGAADFVESLAHGYDTPLGRVLDEQGTDLSGGQWQRLAIARALYAEPEVLVLDEPAAALDPQAEADLYAYFGGLASERRTTLLVTHRLGAARIADRIAVLHGGRIVEEGTHADLARAGGLYAELWAVQAGWYE